YPINDTPIFAISKDLMPNFSRMFHFELLPNKHWQGASAQCGLSSNPPAAQIKLRIAASSKRTLLTLNMCAT
ncbi:MAG: hypothetical protein ACRERV_11085, partial [Methylococcales bacterium]